MTTIGLVGCASQKLKQPALAKDLYVSALFKKARAYVEENCDQWFILSALHGLVDPETVLDPYDVRLGVGRSAPPIHAWALDVAADLIMVCVKVEDPQLVVLAGEQYRTCLRYLPEDLPRSVPMEGMGIGHQLGFLTRELDAMERSRG